MKDDNALRQYVRAVLREGMFFRTGEEEEPDKGRGFFDKLKSFFMGTGDVDDAVEEWLDEQELYYDLEFPDETRKKIVDFSRKKWDRLISRVRGDKAKAARQLTRALSIKFAPEIREIEREVRRREELEDEEFDRE